MTLANFNSNFNWQLRMLKEAADCCGIVPDIPPPPVIPCYCGQVDGVLGSCFVEYIDCAGVTQTFSTSVGSVDYICAQENTIQLTCLAPFNEALVTGGTVPCVDSIQCAPVVDCYWYAKLHDSTCFQFNPNITNWVLNGVDVFSGWNSLMFNPPYGFVGNALMYADNTAGCGPFNYSDYYFWTVVPSTTISLPSLTGNDSNGDPVTVNMLGPICNRKCYTGDFVVPSGSTIVYGINTAEVNTTDYSVFIDLTDPNASVNFTIQLGQYYPSPPLNVVVTVIGPDEYNIAIEGLYSLGTQVYVFMDDGVTIGTLNEKPCL